MIDTATLDNLPGTPVKFILMVKGTRMGMDGESHLGITPMTDSMLELDGKLQTSNSEIISEEFLNSKSVQKCP
tara:strand:+ start:310 stop:528 length:219 start_codon:yes stop_codon:yes gene_type:complete